MKQVAKVVIINPAGEYLALVRDNHPEFGDDIDLPGGTLDEGEVPQQTAVREVLEETGIVLAAESLRQVYRGTEYSAHGTEYTLYTVTMTDTPQIALSWEHSSYVWLTREQWLMAAHAAKDTYMHMASMVMKGRRGS